MTKKYYWHVSRLIFVTFLLYLVGDIIYRWSGFRYYASLTEFLPAVALVTILWTIVSVFVSTLVWFLFRIIKWLFQRVGFKIELNHFFLFITILALVAAVFFISKPLIYKLIHWEKILANMTLVLLALFFASIALTFLFRNAAKWFDIIQERITPLFWLFAACFLISLPVVAFYTLGKDLKDADNLVTQNKSESQTIDGNRPNIMLVTFDALTSRNMSLYGYKKPTTPNIDKWAESAYIFTRLYAEGNATGTTTASLMTGKRQWTHQRYHLHGLAPLKSNIESLPLMLKKNGYYNLGFMANPIASAEALGIGNGFEIALPPHEFYTPMSLFEWLEHFLEKTFGNKFQLYDWIIKGDFILNKIVRIFSRSISTSSHPPEIVFNKFLSVHEKNPQEPFFVWIHVLPPHSPYLPHEPYMGMFNDSLKYRTYKSQLEILKLDYPDEMQPDVNILRDRYDEFIRYSDEQFGEFMEELEERNKLKNTIIIISSDHGESFQNNYLTHGGPYLFEPVIAIPLIIKLPGQEEKIIINSLLEQIDIPATILDMANIEVPSWMEGRSLVPLLKGNKLPPRPAFSFDFEQNSSRGNIITEGTIAVMENNYKLIYYLYENKKLLFNLKKDPDELNDIFEEEQETGQRLLAIIQENLRKANERIRKGE